MTAAIRGRHARRNSRKDPTVVSTYSEARAVAPGTRLIDANGDQWLRKGAGMGASLEPVHRPRADAVLLAIAPPDRALPYGPFGTYPHDPRFPPCATQYCDQARAALRTATHHLSSAAQRVSKLAPAERDDALAPVTSAHTRAHDAEQLRFRRRRIRRVPYPHTPTNR